MGQQISIEAALTAFRRKYGEATETIVLLEVKVAELEAELEQLRGPLGHPDPDVYPSTLGSAPMQG